MTRRIRSIKPEWLDDELLAQASSDARVMSIALILLADDYGNGRAGKVLLAGRAFPGRPVDVAENAVAELVKIRFASLYIVNGQRYFSIRKWDTHQRVDNPGLPGVPGPDQRDTREAPGPVDAATAGDDCKSGTFRKPRESLGEKPETLGGLDETLGADGKSLKSTRASLPIHSSPNSEQTDPAESSGSRRARDPKNHIPFPMPAEWQPSAGQLTALAAKWSVSESRIAAEVPEFRWYWREGKGQSARRNGRGWAQAFGNRVEQVAKNGSLFVARPGAPVAAVAEVSKEAEARRKHAAEVEARAKAAKEREERQRATSAAQRASGGSR